MAAHVACLVHLHARDAGSEGCDCPHCKVHGRQAVMRTYTFDTSSAVRLRSPLSTLPDGIMSRLFRNVHHHRLYGLVWAFHCQAVSERRSLFLAFLIGFFVR